MNRADAPVKQSVPFGINGQREALLPTTPAGDNTASYDAGFPPVTMILKAAGGLPPKGQDMNQILYELSALARWFSAGAVNSYDATFSSEIGGYPKGSVVIGTDGITRYISMTESNVTNPSTGGAGWFNLTNGYLRSDNNLSEIAAAGSAYQLAARQNLGLKGAAILDVGSTAGTVAAGDDPRITGAAQKANNLSDLSSAVAARTNLGGVPINSEVYLSNNNLSELASAGAASQTAARLNLGNVPAKNEVYLSNNNLSEISAAGSAPQAAARGNLGLGTAATRNIGTGSNQVPDMGAFPAGLGSAGALGATGYQRLPSGYIRQWGSAVADSNGDVSIAFPIAFSVKPDAIYFGCRQSGVPTAIQSIIINDPSSDNTKVVCRAYKIDGSLTITGSTSAFYWVAEGKV